MRVPLFGLIGTPQRVLDAQREAQRQRDLADLKAALSDAFDQAVPSRYNNSGDPFTQHYVDGWNACRKVAREFTLS